MHQGRSYLFLLVSSCLCLTGCQSALPRFASDSSEQSCENGVCTVNTKAAKHGKGEDARTPAELFADMNYQQYARKQAEEARVAKIEAAKPTGPDTLFAPYR